MTNSENEKYIRMRLAIICNDGVNWEDYTIDQSIIYYKEKACGEFGFEQKFENNEFKEDLWFKPYAPIEYIECKYIVDIKT